LKKSFFLLETQLFETDRSISLHFKTEEHLKTVLDAVPGAVVVVVAAAEQCCAALTLKKSFHQTLKTVTQKTLPFFFSV